MQLRGELPIPVPGVVRGPGVGLGVQGYETLGGFVEPEMIGLLLGVAGDMDTCAVCGVEEPAG